MISAVVLTHNDQPIIRRCLERISWCDEIIVMDDESTDKTAEIAKKFGATVFTRSLRDDFAAQRNFGLSKARGDWVFFVDSDEVVTPQLAQEIKQVVDIPNPKSQIPNGGYYLKRKDYLFGRWLTHGETANVKLLRLARKNVGKWVRPVHEEWEVKGLVGELTHPLLHYPHQNVAQFLEEVNRYSTLYADYLYSQGVREPLWAIVVKPVAKFFVNYIWRFGFLDGMAGMAVAVMMSFHSFLVRGKLWQLHDTRKDI